MTLDELMKLEPKFDFMINHESSIDVDMPESERNPNIDRKMITATCTLVAKKDENGSYAEYVMVSKEGSADVDITNNDWGNLRWYNDHCDLLTIVGIEGIENTGDFSVYDVFEHPQAEKLEKLAKDMLDKIVFEYDLENW